jgi:hypothetical protein
VSNRLLAAITGAAVVAGLGVASGVPGVLYAVIYTLAVLPGVPLGMALFGRRHPAGWISGALIGYGLTQLALWAVIVSGGASTAGFAAAWLVLCALTLLAARALGDVPALEPRAWSPGDTRALLLVLLLVPALMAPPYRNLGREDSAGYRYYRAYFTADFVWHSALAHELGKFSLPPRNPYLAPRPMNYYWTYFLLPSAVAELAPGEAFDVERCLESNAMLSGVLMIGALFLLARTAVSRPSAAAIGVSLAVVAASGEGLYAIVDLLTRGRPLAALLDMNIDAVSNWSFGGMRIDNVPRSLWYTPQHTTSIGLGLTGLLVAATAGASASLAAVAIAGLALGLATTLNPLLGGICAILYGIVVLSDLVFEREGWRLVPRHTIAAIPVALAVLWGAQSRVMDGAGSALAIGFTGMARRSPVITLLLSIGPVLVPALAAIWRVRAAARRPVVLGMAGILVGLFMLYFVRITEASWVGFRAGQLLLVSCAVLLARTFDLLGPASSRALGLATLILALGLPTTLIDTWNAQDIGNRRPGPGFRWTLWTTGPQRQAFAWLRDHTEPTAIVQMEPMVRAREHWTLIPTFAGRRMAAGLPISLLPLPEYQERSEMVRSLFATGNAAEAAAIARRLRIDYLYVDRDDVAAYPEGVRKFETAAGLFERVFNNSEVAIYRVL